MADGFFEALQIIAFRLQNELKKDAPVDTARLRQSIKVVPRQDGTINVFMAEHWKYVEFGSNPHVISAKNKKSLKFKVDGKNVFRKKVMHPGVRPNPFIRNIIKTKLSKMSEETLDE